MTFCRSPFGLSPLELASGLVFGTVARQPQCVADPPEDPLTALEEAILPALTQGPCFVSFSGGRDSSVVLAAAVSAARREGLPLPVPVTNVFPDATRSSESEWQELVVAHLGLSNWVRLELRDELDCVGPLARGILERHGLLWPFNAHFHAPLLEVARGGTLLTGIGGDELLGTSHWARAAAVLSGAARPHLRDIPRVGLALAPTAVRRAVVRRRFPIQVRLSWLTQRANNELRELAADDVAGEPLRWGGRWHWWSARKASEIGLRSLDLIAEDYGAPIQHPLTNGRFASSVAGLAARKRLHDRTSLLVTAFSSILPSSILERAAKAAFDAVFFGAESRALAKVVAEEVAGLEQVDPGALHVEWSRAQPSAHSYLLLQAGLVRHASAGLPNLHFGTVASDQRTP